MDPGPPFHDAHLHLQDPRLQAHLPQLLADLPALGIRSVVTNGTHEADWPAVAALAASHRWIIPSFGLHPWHVAARAPGWSEALERALDTQPRAAVGEIGLDRWVLTAPAGRRPGPAASLADQRNALVAQLAIAAQRNRAVTLHGLHAWPELAGLLRRTPLPARGFLVHAYSGPGDLVSPLLDLGAHFSFNASVAFRRGFAGPGIFSRLPADRILVETDAPAMPLPHERVAFALPIDSTGAVNHPGNLIVAYAALAAERRTEVPALAATVAANHVRLFGAVD